ncbi:uncharacterized protein LOC120331465 [Styela clava]
MDLKAAVCFIMIVADIVPQSVTVPNVNLTEFTTNATISPDLISNVTTEREEVLDDEITLHRVVNEAEIRSAIAHPGEDFSAHPDVIYVVQRSGVSDQDFGYVQKFIGQGVQAMSLVGSKINESRVGVDIVTDNALNFVNFETCCQTDRTHLLMKIDREMTMYNQTRMQQFPIADHIVVSPHPIDFVRPLQFIRGQYLKGGLARKKPTLLILVFNFQSPYMSYRLLDSAVDEIRACKDAGAHVVSIVIDSEPNRQPRHRNSGLRQRHSGPLSQNELFVEEAEAEYFRNIFRKFRSSEQETTAFDDGDDDPRYWKIKSGRTYEDMSRLYAIAMASRRDHGFKLRYFSELASGALLNVILGLITNPMSFFGDGELRASCENTKNHITRSIWSPGFYNQETYDDHVQCEWRIAARYGFRVELTFDRFATERKFDKVTIYDGYEREKDQIIEELSGELTNGEKKITILSTEERMSITFITDGGFRDTGFHAVWEPSKQEVKISDATVVYLVDVSSSLTSKDLEPVRSWIKIATKHFYFDGGIGYRSASLRSSNAGSRFGLLSFDNKCTVLMHIAQPKNRVQFYQSLNKMNHTLRETHIGSAMDFVRKNQFLYVLGENAFMVQPHHPDHPQRKPPKRILFLFSDGYSVDDPRPAARRLCEWDIVPVFIETGDINLKTRDDIISFCGLNFSISEPIKDVLEKIKIHLMIITNETTTPEPPITPPGLPSKPPAPTRTTTTTTTTTPTPPTTWPPWTGTLPTIKTPTSTPTPAIPDLFDYSAIAILLATIGFCETVTLITMICRNICHPPEPLSLESSISHELLKKKLAAREAAQQAENEFHEIDEAEESALEDKISRGSSNIESLSSRERLQKETSGEHAQEPEVFSIDITQRPTRYPSAANSFFERGAFLPKHLQEINKNDIM